MQIQKHLDRRSRPHDQGQREGDRGSLLRNNYAILLEIQPTPQHHRNARIRWETHKGQQLFDESTVDPLTKGAPKAGDSHGNHDNHASDYTSIFIIFNLLDN